MKHIVLPLALVLISCTATAEDSVISFSMGQKTLHFDLEGYEFDGVQIQGVKSSATAVYAALGYEYSKKITLVTELGVFSGANSGSNISVTAGGSNGTVREELDVLIEPTTYLSAYGHYFLTKNYRVKPFLLAGLSFIAAESTASSKKETQGSNSANSLSLSSDGLGLTYGFGFDIAIVDNVSFVVGYRVQQDVAEQSTTEFNGAFSYQF
jgi:opacity protein-like surface antigen